MLDGDFSDSEKPGRKRTLSVINVLVQPLLSFINHKLNDFSSLQSDDYSSSSDDESLRNEIKLQHKIIREEKFQQRKLERQQEKLEPPQFMALKSGHKFQGFRPTSDQPKKKLAK